MTMENEMTELAAVSTNTPVPRTSAGLRGALFDELDSLRDGKSNAAKSIARWRRCRKTLWHRQHFRLWRLSRKPLNNARFVSTS